MAMQEDMERATKAAGDGIKEMENKQNGNDICTCPECGYQGQASEFREQEQEPDEGEEPKAGMEVQIEVGKPKPRLMSAREAVVSAIKGK